MKRYKLLLAIAVTAIGCIAIKPSSRIQFEATDAYPEGIAYDSIRQVYYVSSARLGTIGKVTSGGTYTVLYQDPSLKSSYGMKIHPDGKRLFVCVGDANYSKYTSPSTRTKMARLISIDLESNKKIDDIDLSTLIQGKRFPNDLIFDDKSNCYITDSYAHAIYKVTPEGKASLFAQDKKFETEGIGINGIVYHPSGFLIVDNTNNGQLYKVSLDNPRAVEKIEVDQYFVGGDGLLLNHPNQLTIVVNGGNDKIFQLGTDDNWKSAKLSGTTLIADRFTYPATVTRNANDLWVMNARFNELLDSNSVPPKYFAIQKAVIKPIPKTKNSE